MVVLTGFFVIPLRDYREQDLLQNNNPFAMVILSVLLEQRANKLTDQQLLEEKVKLATHLIRQNLPAKKQDHLLDFIKCYSQFRNKEFTNLFDDKLLTLTNKIDNMGIREIILEETRKEGIAEGIKKGQREGRREGRREGESKAKSRIARLMLAKTNLSEKEIAEITGVRSSFIKELKSSAATQN